MVKNLGGRGLPARIFLPVFVLFAVFFLGVMIYLVRIGFGSTGSIFGNGVPAGTAAGRMPTQSNAYQVQGGPPAAVTEQLATLRKQIAKHPNDDVALTQLGDMYLTVGMYKQAIPYYQRALIANPRNAAAQTGLTQASESLREAGR